MRWLSKGVAATLLALLAVLLIAPSASAVEPPPAPVVEIPDVPSRTAASVSGSPLGDSVLVDIWRAMSGQRAGGTSLNTIPKIITPPAALSRIVLGAEAPIAGFMAGWAVGANGTLALMAVANGSTFEEVSCSQPGWYQGVTSFVSLSISPDCTALFESYSPDITSGGVVTYAGYSMGFTGTGVARDDSYNIKTLYCGYNSGPPLASGYELVRASGWTPLFSFTVLEQCAPYPPSIQVVMSSGTFPLYNIRSTSTGAVVAEMSPPVTVPGSTAVRTPECELTEGADTFTGTGTPYTEADGLPLTAEGLGCAQAMEDLVSSPGRGPGFLPDRISVGSRDESGAITEISEQDVPDFGPDQRRALEPQTGNGVGLQLVKVVGTTLDSCMTWEADCANWWEESEEGTSTTSPYRCLFAGVAVSLAECGPYRYTFDTKTSTPTITDPATGLQTPWQAGAPSTSNSINPGTGPGTSASPGDACFASWPSTPNPLEWVLHPVKCALVWAFVPRVATVESTISGLGEAAGDVAAVDPLMALVDMLPAGGGCSGIPVSLTFFGQTATGSLLGACDGYGATAAAVVNGLLTLVVSTGAILAVTRYAAAVFGFVGPGGNIEQTQYQAMQRAARND